MSYLKLCQISNNSIEVASYIEDAHGNVVVNNPNYPLELVCEVIDWIDEDAFQNQGKANSFTSEIVVLESAPENMREAVYQQLKVKYPNLNK